MSSTTVQEILTTHWPAMLPTLSYVAGHTRKVVNALMMCRTPLLGAHRYRCDSEECDHSLLVNNSCRNRHCPTCQALARAEWLVRRLDELLPTHYFHVVFTLPRELRPLVKKNRREVYQLMFKAASQTILTLAADPKRLGGKAGLILMLHTWTQRLTFHPHLHGIIPGGVLARDGERWIGANKDFFLPVEVVGRMFRGKLLAFLRQGHTAGKIAWPKEQFDSLVDTLYRTRWHVYLEPSFRNPIRVVKYLATYTNRVAISDKRILSVADGKVRYRYVQRGKHVNVPQSEEIEGTEFVSRFLEHILPQGFVKIRYYGLLSNRARAELLPTALQLIEQAALLPAHLLRTAVADELLRALNRSTPRLCPLCGIGRLRITERLAPTPPAVAWKGND